MYYIYIYNIQYLLLQTNIYVFYMLNESWAVCGRGATEEEEERVRRRPGRRQTSDVAQTLISFFLLREFQKIDRTTKKNLKFKKWT